MTPAPKLPRAIVLTGPMGVGKSGNGRRLAAALSRPFYDADDEIIAQEGRSIAEIFATDGEPAFRAIEERVCVQLISAQTPSVIALGGGAFMNPRIREACEAPGVLSVYLRAQPETSWERIVHSKGAAQRPLLALPDPLSRLQELFKARDPVYKLAAETIETDAMDKGQTLEALLQLLGIQDPRDRTRHAHDAE